MASSISGINFTLTEDDDLDATIFQGCDIEFALQETDDDDEPVDVSGYDAKMTLRRQANDNEIVAEFTVGNGRVSIGSTDGLIQFVMTAVDSAALPAGKGVYEIRFTNADGKTWQPQGGKYTITREITRD